jgi:hypothetical protein
MELLDRMIRWEGGRINHDDEIELFQELVNSGLVWQLGDIYGRHAEALITAGLITRPSTSVVMDNRQGYR